MKSIPLAFDFDRFRKCQQALDIHEIPVADVCLVDSVSYLNALTLSIVSLPFTILSPGAPVDILHYSSLHKNPYDKRVRWDCEHFCL